MKIKDIENAVMDFCAKEGILVVNGFIDPKHLNKIEIFLDILKVSSKAKAEFLRKEPQAIGNILRNLPILKKIANQ